MRSTQGQKYTANLFFGGLINDIDPEMIDNKTGGVLEAHYFHVSNTVKNILQKVRGSEPFIVDIGLGAPAVLVGALWLNGYLVEFWYYNGSTHIFANGILVADHSDIPGDATHYLDIDKNTDTWEMFITDNDVCPVVLDLDDMLASTSTTEYFADYDRKLYEINKVIELNQPVFQCLENLGAGGGLRAGSYAYAMRYVSMGGDKTAWSPTTPYIPIPYNIRTGSTDAIKANSGVLIAGQASSLEPTRYGIRLKIRVTNTIGFDYIELKRYSNTTGQPVSYVPTAEYLIMSLDMNGSVVNIRDNPHSVVEFLDNDTMAWAILDESVLNTYSTIKRARTIRYFNRRIVLGGVEYESKELPTQDIFVTDSGTSKIAIPIIKQLGYEGFSGMQNQVYNKSHRSGERYGFAVELFDQQGNMLYAVPLSNNTTQAQVVHVTLTGDSGNVSIGHRGMAFPVTFDTDLDTTAANFVTTHTIPFQNLGIILSSSGPTIIFTAAVPGVPFDEISIIYTTPIPVLNSIYTIQNGQTGTPATISFSATNTGAAGIVRVNYRVRNSSHTVIQANYQDFNMSVGTHNYTIVGVNYPIAGENYDVQIDLTTSYTLTSNHFDSLAYADPIYNLYKLSTEEFELYKDNIHTVLITAPTESPYAYGTVGTPNIHVEFWPYQVDGDLDTVTVRIFDFNGIEVYNDTCIVASYGLTEIDAVINRDIVAGDVFNIVIGI